MNRGNIPSDEEDISEVLDFEMFPFQQLDNVNIYLRDENACPFGRGNWLIDIHFKDGKTFCIKLPMEMAEARVIAYCQPLLDKLKGTQSA